MGNRFKVVALSFPLLVAARTAYAAELRPPRHVKAERQDFQAARISWEAMGKNVRYQLYAAFDQEPLDFHKEHNGQPIAENVVVWDAPRLPSHTDKRRFVFYVTAVNKQGRESVPSKHARVDLGPLPTP